MIVLFSIHWSLYAYKNTLIWTFFFRFLFKEILLEKENFCYIFAIEK